MRWRSLLKSRAGWALLLILLTALAVSIWRNVAPATVAPAWRFQVFHDDIPRISALVIDAEQQLLITQEFLSGQGTLLQRDAQGQLQRVLGGLSKPDGLVRYQDGVVLGQEGGEFPVQWLRDGRLQNLFEASHMEGLASDGRYLYGIEDKALGRLLRYDPQSRELTTLREGLSEGEGVAVCGDGRLFYTEKGKNWVKQWQAEGEDRLVLADLQQPGFLLCDEQGLWITEDATHRARVLLLDTHNQLQVVMRHLRAPQTILGLGGGRYLLAEQGRSRILELQHLSHGL